LWDHRLRQKFCNSLNVIKSIHVGSYYIAYVIWVLDTCDGLGSITCKAKGKAIPVQTNCRARGFHDVKALRFQDIRQMKVVRLLALNTGRLYPPGNIPRTHVCSHPASCKMGTWSFPGVKCGRSVLLTTHLLLVLRSWKSRALPLSTHWATPE